MAFSYTESVAQMRKVFNSGRTKSLEWRKRQLEALVQMINDHSEDMCEAMKKDLNKAHMESIMMETGMCKNEAIHILNNLDEWAKPQPVKKNMLVLMDDCYIRPEPLGLALIMGAWNYPIQLTLLPLIGAISAGNCAVLKPSELSEETALLLGKIIPKYLDTDCIAVVNGGIPETTALLKERFDFIFYTGNSTVGKIVMEAAAKNLTPVTLELGGKSPCFVDQSSDMEVAANRIMWGKFVNCGQTCVAPDYIVCTPRVKEQLLPKLKATAQRFWGDDPQKSPDLGRLVNNRHFHRVKKFLDCGEVFIGGQTDEKDKYIAPTVLHNVKPTDHVMQEEIFGPVLPIMTVESLAEAINFVNSREKPLAAYLFSKDKSVIDNWISQTTSGGMCVNDTVIHGGVETLPFGGVGHSGMGAYHGRFTFDTFCHKRGVLCKKQKMEALNNLRYPPYTEKKESWMVSILSKKRTRKVLVAYFPLVMLGVLLAIVFKARVWRVAVQFLSALSQAGRRGLFDGQCVLRPECLP